MVFWETVLLYVGVLLATAWVTISERKLLAGSQARKGPNKVSWKGVFQPFSDAVKLILKEQPELFYVKVILYFFSPIFSLIVTLLIWMLWPVPANPVFFQVGILFFICLSSIHVYSNIMAGWSSSCTYSSWGTFRSVSMAVSYEIPLVMVFLMLGLLGMSWDFSDSMHSSHGVMLFFLLGVLNFCVFFFLIMEFNRAPFDLIEAESELVSGFNTEYSSVGFVLLFLAEYAQQIIGIQIICFLVLGGVSWVFVVLVGLMVNHVVLLARAAYPRMKVEVMMDSCWKGFLPVTLLFLLAGVLLVVLWHMLKKQLDS